MKPGFFLFLVSLLASCKEEGNREYVFSVSANVVSTENGVVFFNHEKFNGTLFEMSQNKKDTLWVERYKNGLLDGICKKWFPNRQLMEYREYSSGRKHGKQIAFWENGNKRFEFTANDDAYEGEMKEWSENGKLFHLAHYTNGQEDGSQKMWYENGKIRANYSIIKGKRYGLLGTKNCKNVSDSIFVVE
jgi:antitoxin component YwqK of YwqJK toxin-antitoxin module